MSQRLTAVELAGFLRVSVSTIRQWQQREGIPYIPCGPRLRFYSPDAVQEWLNAKDAQRVAAKGGRPRGTRNNTK